MSPRIVLLLCALALGSSAHSPIPEMEETISSWSEMTRNPAFRLPTTTSPSHYTLSITPFFDDPDPSLAFTFDGLATIDLSPQEPGVTEIVMHCNDLTINAMTVTTTVDGVSSPVATNGVLPTCDPIYHFMRINVLQPLVLNQVYSVNIAYRGNLQNNMRGFYRSWYYDSTGNKRWMATTQFQPGHAREAFPCYDEPAFKATFDITIVRETTFSPSISNMPISSTDTDTSLEGRTSETFYRTPLMSTYLIAFIVSHYEVSESTPANDPRPFQIIARDNVGDTGAWAFEVGVALLDYMEEYADIPYYEMATNMDMKQVAIPDFSAGAMENWGLLTYREALILYDPANSNHFYRQRVANIVAHEITHMWFGNLVTCDWWSNLWLNEGFARFYTYFLAGAVLPELGFETRFIVEQVHVSMLSDSVDSAHSLTDHDVNNPAQVSAHFSTITYARGASIIRMTQHFLGDPTFVKGLRTYLKDRKYDVAEPDHLFKALDGAAAEDEALAPYTGITISEYFKTWSEKAGHPILTVVVNHQTGQMTVTQARWERDTGVSNSPSLWQIPITWTRQNNRDFDDTKPSQVLTEQITVMNRGSEGFEWVLFNKQQTGFYKVNYDTTTWNLLTLALRSDQRSLIHEYNRAQIVDDLFQLSRANVMSYTRAFNILSFLEFESDYAPWLAAITGYNFVRARLAHDQERQQNMHNLIIGLSRSITARLGYVDVPGESYMDGLLRMYLLTFLCNIGHQECNAAALTNFANFRNNNQAIPPNMRPWVYCGGLRQGTVDDFNFLWNRYLNEDLASEKVVLLETLGCSPHAASIEAFLAEIVADNESVRPQDHNVALNSAVSGNEGNTWIAFQWLQNNHAAVTARLGSIAQLATYITGRLRTEQQIAQVEAWMIANPNVPGVGSGLTGVETARRNLEWSAGRVSEMDIYFENGYQPCEIEEEESEEATEPTEPPSVPTEPEDGGGDDDGPGSANVAKLGFVTLIITLCVNFVNY